MILDSPDRRAPFTQARRARLQDKIASEKLDALIVTEMVNIRYLTGFTGTAAIFLLTPRYSWFLTDFRYAQQAQEQVVGPEVLRYTEALDTLAGLLSKLGLKNVGFEAESVSAAKADQMGKKLKSCTLEPTVKLVESVRLIKDEAELEAMRALVGMLEAAIPEAMRLICPGAVERDVAVELEYRLRKLGAQGPAFDFIVASGFRSALPHGVASGKAIGDNELVILDWGAMGWGYHSDNTRTFATGAVEKELENIYHVVLEANQEAIASLAPGVPLEQVDRVAREIVTKAGYGGAFGHGTGHGVGLCVHEDPVVSWRSESVAQPGMVFTIEPGIYLPGKGGVRIEDMVHVTGEGVEILTDRLGRSFRTLG